MRYNSLCLLLAGGAGGITVNAPSFFCSSRLIGVRCIPRPREAHSSTLGSGYHDTVSPSLAMSVDGSKVYGTPPLSIVFSFWTFLKPRTGLRVAVFDTSTAGCLASMNNSLFL